MTEQQPLIPPEGGELLKVARLGKKLAQRQVAEQLRCPVSVIEALEKGDAIDMAPIYLRGHIKRYAQLLELTPEQIDEVLAPYEPVAPVVQTVFEKRPPAPSTERWLRVASYLLASLLVGTLAWQVTREAVRLSTVDPDPVTAPAEEQAQVVKESHVNASIASLENLHTPSSSPVGDAGSEAWRAIQEAKDTQLTLAQGAHRLTIETSADSWVEVSEDNGRVLEQDLLRGGERRQYQGNGPFRISLGRSSAVRLSIDGTAVDLTPYTRDDVARLLLDPATITDPAESAEADVAE